MIRAATALLTILLLAPAGAGAERVYRWVHADGTVHYGERPPASPRPGPPAIVRVPGGSRAPETAASALERTLLRIERQIEMERDLRATRLGVTRYELDRLEGRAPAAAAPPRAPALSHSDQVRLENLQRRKSHVIQRMQSGFGLRRRGLSEELRSIDREIESIRGTPVIRYDVSR